MKEAWLSLNGKHYSIRELQAWQSSDPLTSFEQSTLTFCRDWLRGRQTFTISTSGSTGKPKLIDLHRSTMEASARLTIDALGLKAGDHSLLCLDTHYIAGQMMLVRSLIGGMNIVGVEPSTDPLARVESGVRIDFVAVVPNQLMGMLRSGSDLLENIKTVIVGGAPVNDALKNILQGLKAAIYATYGMTETVSHIALQKLNGADAQDYFQVLPGITVGQDERGCLTIEADYLRRDKIITNDRVELVFPDKFRWLGRWDRVINTGGIKVAPEKVEAASASVFESRGLSHRFFVAGAPDETLGNKVVLIVEGNNASPDLVKYLLAHLKDRLEKYEVPREIHFVKNFVETPTQKIDQAATLRLI